MSSPAQMVTQEWPWGPSLRPDDMQMVHGGRILDLTGERGPATLAGPQGHLCTVVPAYGKGLVFIVCQD